MRGVINAALFALVWIANGAALAQPQPLRVDVTLSEYRLTLPSALAPGHVRFHVVNRGHDPHGFAIASGTHMQRIPGMLAPGASADLDVALSPGVYAVYSPSEGDRAQGMEQRLEVKPADQVPAH